MLGLRPARRSGFFSPEDPRLFHPLLDALLNEDRFLVLADFRAYADAQIEVRDLDETKAQEAVQAAMGLASERSNPEVTPVHLLLALVLFLALFALGRTWAGWVLPGTALLKLLLLLS